MTVDPATPQLAPGGRVAVDEPDRPLAATSGLTGTLIGPETNGNTHPEFSAIGWWVRVDHVPPGPYAGGLMWLPEAKLRALPDGA